MCIASEIPRKGKGVDGVADKTVAGNEVKDNKEKTSYLTSGANYTETYTNKDGQRITESHKNKDGNNRMAFRKIANILNQQRARRNNGHNPTKTILGGG